MTSPSRRKLLRALAEFDQALADNRETWKKAQATLRKTRRQIEQGAPVTVALRSSGVPERRAQMAEVAKRLERARHNTRLAVIKEARGEGISLGELARLWGMSRQRVQVLAKELHNHDE